MGILEDIAPTLEDHTLELEPGDVVLLFTDGLTEISEDGQMLGTDGLVSKLRAVVSRTTDPAAIVQGILGPLTGKALDDDVTVMAVRYAPAEAAQ